MATEHPSTNRALAALRHSNIIGPIEMEDGTLTNSRASNLLVPVFFPFPWIIRCGWMCFPSSASRASAWEPNSRPSLLCIKLLIQCPYFIHSFVDHSTIRTFPLFLFPTVIKFQFGSASFLFLCLKYCNDLSHYNI